MSHNTNTLLLGNRAPKCMCRHVCVLIFKFSCHHYKKHKVEFDREFICKMTARFIPYKSRRLNDTYKIYTTKTVNINGSLNERSD
jgi:hypothetical protein